MRYELYQNMDGWYFSIDNESEEYKLFLSYKTDDCVLVGAFIEKEMASLMMNILNKFD